MKTFNFKSLIPGQIVELRDLYYTRFWNAIPVHIRQILGRIFAEQVRLGEVPFKLKKTTTDGHNHYIYIG